MAADNPSTSVWIDDVNTFRLSIFVLDPDNISVPPKIWIAPLTIPDGRLSKSL